MLRQNCDKSIKKDLQLILQVFNIQNWSYKIYFTMNLRGEETKLKTLFASLWTSYIPENRMNPHYGFGWNTQILYNRRIIFHPGVAGTEYLNLLRIR